MGAEPLSSTRDQSEDIALGFRAIERWRVDEARRIAERAYASSPEDPLVLALVAELKMHMSDYRGAAEFFRRAKEGGAPDHLVDMAPLAEAARIATEGYDEHVGDHFVVRTTPGKDSVLVPYALETLERARERIGELLGWRPESRIIVEIYPSAGTLAMVSTLTQKEIEASGTIALCKWNRLMITTPRAIVFGYSWRDTIAHELTHLIIGGASQNTVPIWLHEGIAKYAETAWRGEPGEGLSTELQIALREAAKKNALIPFEKMHPSMAKLKSQEETGLAFAEVFTFIEYLIDRKGWEGLRQTLQHMASGTSDEQAIQAVYGRSLKSLSEDWMKTLKTRPIRGGNVLAGAERKVLVKSRPDAPDDRLHGLSKRGRRFARAADLLYARGRARAAERELEKAFQESGSPLISAKLAMVALAAGDLDVAEDAARQAISGTPDLAGPSVTLAEVLVRRGKTAEAKAPLEDALSVNPFDPRIHHLMMAVHGKSGDEDAQKQALRAIGLLSGEIGTPAPRSLGHGGLVQIEAFPFSRVYVVRDVGDGPGLDDPTGMVTPTVPFEMRPGTFRIILVPPSGPKIGRTVTVKEKSPDGAPQLISSDS